MSFIALFPDIPEAKLVLGFGTHTCLTENGFNAKLEFEGKENPETGVPKSIAMLRKAFAQ